MIQRLSATTASEAQRIGGKGLGLVRLMAAGLPVPDAWCIPAEVSLDPAARKACLDQGLKAWWAEEDGAGTPWAVRSSAVAEDLAEASFAGVYETVLGVDSLSDLRAAVEKCWASVEQERAQTYRAASGVEAGGGIALILQRMLEPDVAGVLLTANPLRPLAREIAIDAAWGLGETVVSGRTDPDHFVLDRASGEVREHRLGAKLVEAVWDVGLQEREVEVERRERPSLDAGQLQALHGLASQVTGSIGPRRDIEWAIVGERLFVLQDRPITNLPSEDPDDVWSRLFGDEYLSECTLPLPADLMWPWLVEVNMHEMAKLQGRKDLLLMEPLRSYRGYTYFSAAYMATTLTMLPRSMRRSAAPDWFPALVDDRILAPRWNPRLLLGVLRAPGRDKEHSGLQGNLDALERHCATIDRDIVPLLSQDVRVLSDAEWQRQYDAVADLGREHFRVLRWGMTIYNTFLHGGLERLLGSWCDDDGKRLYQDVIGGLDDTHTAALNREVDELARRAADDDAVTSLLRGGAGYDEARAATGFAVFWNLYDEFLGRHGHRSTSRDISRSRWREEPALVLELVRAQLRAAGIVRSTPAGDTAQARRRAAEKQALERAGRGPLGGARRRILSRVMARTQQYTRYRENQRYHLDYLLTQMRALVLEQGRRLTNAGVLAQADDVFLLSGKEFWTLVRGERLADGLDARLEERRREHARNSARLPATYLFDDIETEVASEQVAEQGDLPEGAMRGTGVCRGLARGPARVVADLSDLGSIEAGDILVAPNIDPGWTSVFPLLAGLVIETGGTLSHGAILAREYGLPAVSGVTGALTAFTSGEPLEVDGDVGVVSIMAPAGSAA